MADFNFFLNRQGVRGNKGEQGEQGYSPRITVKTETAAEYVLNVQNEDGSFDTPNLRGNAIENLGGTYVRFDQDTEQMYTGYADTASTTSQGEVVLSTYEDLTSGGDKSEVTTSKDVHDFVEAKISEASVNYVDIDDYTQKMNELDGEISDLDNNKLDFTDLSNTLAAGTNITITPNAQTGKITIAGEPVSQAQADWNQSDTDAPDYIKNKPTIPEAITVDSELSATSTNPVQNRLITNAINLISNEFENYATNKLDNLSNEGEARLHALKCYSDNGEVLTDTEGLNNIIKYAHSTFDLSKFTVVGSPVITDDGVASGFSDLNYIRIPMPDLSTANTWEIDGKFKLSALNTSNGSYVFASSPGNTALLVGINANNHLTINLGNSDGNGWQTSEGATESAQTLSTNTDYYYKFIFTGTAYQLFISTDNDVFIKYCEFISSTKIGYNSSWNFTLGNSRNPNANNALRGSIDLKQFSITVDGIPVFSGNKTGIDTIKPDDYTVVGTPTISADGVASGFVSRTNYITATYESTTPTTSIDMWSKVIITDTTETSGIYCGIDGNLRLQRSSATAIGIRGFAGNLVCDVTNLSLALNDEVIIHANVTGTGATVDVWVNGVKSSNSVESTNTIGIAYSHINIGGQYSNGNYSCSNAVDLNGVKVGFDGKLTYQPCLKIPYTESKTGSKIVNAVYRDRVNDMVDQFGYANYYTLDEGNGTFTLPQVELYGMIERINGEIGDVESILNSINSGNGGQ